MNIQNSNKRVQQDLIDNHGVQITKIDMFESSIEFPEGTLSLNWDSAFGGTEHYYLLPDQTMCLIRQNGALSFVREEVADSFKREILRVNGR